MENHEEIEIEINPDTIKALIDVADKQNRDISQLIEDALSEYIDRAKEQNIEIEKRLTHQSLDLDMWEE